MNRLAYKGAKDNARRRQLEFALTYEQWSAVWAESGRWAQRGRCRGQYQMDRIDNTKGYVPGNVQIVLGHINRTKDSPHGWHPKLTEAAVRDIRENFKKSVRGREYFAAKYGVAPTTVKQARSGRSWSNVAQ